MQYHVVMLRGEAMSLLHTFEHRPSVDEVDAVARDHGLHCWPDGTWSDRFANYVRLGVGYTRETADV